MARKAGRGYLIASGRRSALGGSVGRGAIGLVGATEAREGALIGQEPGPYSDRMRRCRRTNGT